MSKRNKVKLPKRIAGVKIPKAARQGPVADFLNSSGGQILLAEALVLAAGVYGVRRFSRSGQIDEQEGLRENVAQASARISHAFGEALRAFRAALQEERPVVGEIDDEPGTEAMVGTEEIPEESVVGGVTPAKKKRAHPPSESPTAIT